MADEAHSSPDGRYMVNWWVVEIVPQYGEPVVYHEAERERALEVGRNYAWAHGKALLPARAYLTTHTTDEAGICERSNPRFLMWESDDAGVVKWGEALKTAGISPYTGVAEQEQGTFDCGTHPEPPPSAVEVMQAQRLPRMKRIARLFPDATIDTHLALALLDAEVEKEVMQ